MKYIIIGLVIAYLAIPFIMALDISYDFHDFLSEWWDSFKEFAPMLTSIIAMVVAIAFVFYGMVTLSR